MSLPSFSLSLFAVLLACLPPTSQATSQATAQEGIPGDVANLLDRLVDVDLRGKHLQDLISDLRENYGIPLALDRRALEDVNLETDKGKSLATYTAALQQVALQLRRQLQRLDVRLAPDDELLAQVEQLAYPGADFVARNVPLRDALHHGLAAWGGEGALTFDVRDDHILITSQEQAEENLVTRVYDVRGLVRVPADQRTDLFDPIGDINGEEFDYDTLIELLTTVVAPDSWDDVGGPASVWAGQGTLTFSQTRSNHELIGRLFAQLELLQAERKQATPNLAPVWIHASEATARQTQRVLDALAVKRRFAWRNVPLATVVASLRQELEIPIRVDYDALDDAGIDVWSPVAYEESDVSVQAALESLLDGLDRSLTFVVHHGVLLITLREVEEEQMQLRLYPVWDLVRREGAELNSGTDAWDYDSLMESISGNAVPDSWDDVGGPASMQAEPIAGVLAVSQTRRVHARVAALIDEFRRVAARQRAEAPQTTDIVQGDYLTVVFRLWQPYSEKAIVPEEDVVKLLREMIEPESWQAEEVFVRTLPSRLIIRQKKSVQRRIYQTLQDLGILKPLGDFNPATGVNGDPAGGTMGGMGGGGGMFGVGGGIGGFGGSAAGALPPGSP